MSLAIRLGLEPCRSLDFTALGVVYSTLGSPMMHPIRQIILQNSTDTEIWLSNNGIDDQIPMQPHSYMILDITSNKTIPVGFFLAEGQQIYVRQRGGVPSVGTIDMSVIYGSEV